MLKTAVDERKVITVWWKIHVASYNTVEKRFNTIQQGIGGIVDPKLLPSEYNLEFLKECEAESIQEEEQGSNMRDE